MEALRPFLSRMSIEMDTLQSFGPLQMKLLIPSVTVGLSFGALSDPLG